MKRNSSLLRMIFYGFFTSPQNLDPKRFIVQTPGDTILLYSNRVKSLTTSSKPGLRSALIVVRESSSFSSRSCSSNRVGVKQSGVAPPSLCRNRTRVVGKRKFIDFDSYFFYLTSPAMTPTTTLLLLPTTSTTMTTTLPTTTTTKNQLEIAAHCNNCFIS